MGQFVARDPRGKIPTISLPGSRRAETRLRLWRIAGALPSAKSDPESAEDNFLGGKPIRTAFFVSLGKMRARIPHAVWEYRRVLKQPSCLTGLAGATRGMRRGTSCVVPLLHKLLFPERILTGRKG
jgi:hypothetical protein